MLDFLNRIPPITKNLLFLNVLMFIVVNVLHAKGIYLETLLSAHYFNSPLFEPFQLVTHLFMHGSLGHLFSNMFGLVIFGSLLERLWGPKRYFFFYFISGIGAIILYNAIGVYQIELLNKELLTLGVDPQDVAAVIGNSSSIHVEYFQIRTSDVPEIQYVLNQLNDKLISSLLGASGAVFGVSAGFALLFPNTEIQLLFFPMPIKAKFLIGGYFLLELYLSFQTVQGDNVAHLAHVGGAITGGIIVLIWRRNSKTFY